MMSEKQVKERIYKLKEELRILEEVLETKREGFGRPKGSLKFSSEQIKFLHDYREEDMKKLVKLFNAKFGTNYPINSRALYNFMERTGIISPQPRENNIHSEKNEGVE